MNKKKVAVIACLLILSLALIACNKVWRQDEVTGAQLDKPVESNGGLVVKQGKHIYFVNGYEGADIENEFGTPLKTAILRAELDENGNIVEDSQTVIVPKNIYTSSTDSGIYIYDGWIYYATPNVDKDTDGNASTTHLDFMRTKLDATITQRLHTIDSRTVEFRFTEGRLVFVEDSTIYSLDLNAKKVTDASSLKTLAEDISASKIIYAPDSDFGSYVLYTKNPSDDLSSKTYNELYAVNADGTKNVKILGETSYTDNVDDLANIFKVTVLKYQLETAGLTVYYTKSATVGGSSVAKGLFCYQFSDTTFTFDKSKEKQLTYNTVSTIYPLGYNEGVLIGQTASITLAKSDENGKPLFMDNEQRTIINRAATVRFILNGYVYYTNSSSITAIYRFPMSLDGVEEKVADISPTTTGFAMEVLGDWLYYIDTGYNYIYRVNLNTVDGEKELVGKMTETDAEKLAEEEADD